MESPGFQQLISAKDETISALKSEVVALRKIIENLTGKQDPTLAPIEGRKPPEIKPPPILDKDTGRYRAMNDEEKLDYVGTINEVFGINVGV